MTTSSQAQVRPSAIRDPRPFVGPAVIAVRGPSRSGKTTMCERLIPALTAEGLRVAWFKRTHHTVDLPGKASDRVWLSNPAASVVRATDRLLLTLPPGGSQPQDMLAQLPAGIDVVLFETHESLPYPTILSSELDPEPSENVLGRWSLYHEDAAVLDDVARDPGHAGGDVLDVGRVDRPRREPVVHAHVDEALAGEEGAPLRAEQLRLEHLGRNRRAVDGDVRRRLRTLPEGPPVKRPYRHVLADPGLARDQHRRIDVARRLAELLP